MACSLQQFTESPHTQIVISIIHHTIQSTSVRSLYDRLPTWRVIWVGKLHWIFSNNGYPEAIIRAGSEGSPGRREEEVRDEQGDKPLVVTVWPQRGHQTCVQEI